MTTNRRQFFGVASTLTAVLLGAERRGVAAGVGRGYRERLDHELSIIRARGLSRRFLAAAELTRFARDRGIAVSPGRGSAPSSLVAHLLGITVADPLVHGLLFERFVHSRLPVAPNICLDVCAARQGEVIAHAVESLGGKPELGGQSTWQVTSFPDLGVELGGLPILTTLQAASGHPLDLAAMPLDDAATFQTLAAGHCPGFHDPGFYDLDTGQFSALLRALRPTRFEDLVTCWALCRPGLVATAEELIARRRGWWGVESEHPLIAHILGDTQGLILYQEQIMLIAATVAGHSLADADVLRRALQKRGDRLAAEEARFLDGARARGVLPSVSRAIFSRLAQSAPRSFNRSHAVSCALISYWAAHLVTHAPRPTHSPPASPAG
jgi:DNA polymerase III alpha subunit